MIKYWPLLFVVACHEAPPPQKPEGRNNTQKTVNTLHPWPPEKPATYILVKKSKGTMYVYSKNELVRTYKVALGRQPLGHKQYEGDMRTPEGKYTINGKNPHSKYYKNLGISYPNSADLARAKTLGKPAGGDVKIHGLPPEYAHLGTLQSQHNWTYGCIALSNEQMEELYRHTNPGIPIEILP